MEALWWQKDDLGLQCRLCFRGCRPLRGETGYCGARAVDDSGFISPYLGLFSSQAVDPIEKKPLYHWRPGSRIFSLGSVGCTMRCPFCQNHQIAQPQRQVPLRALAAGSLAALLRRLELSAVAYTYNEPALQAEYILEAAPHLAEGGTATVLVTNGLFGQEPLTDLLPWISAANVDLKTFDPQTYRELGGDLATVLNTIERLVQAGTHVEITTLVVPGISDRESDFAAQVEWLAKLDQHLPLHIARYFPAHRSTAPATEVELLRRFQKIAQSRLRRVHLGNVR